MNPGRNDPCPCGSGEKYKKCCGELKSGSPTQPQNVRADNTALNRHAKGAVPENDELNQLVALYKAGRYAELESRSRLLLEQYPASGFVWKILGITLQVQGKNGIPSLLKAREFLPNHADVHNNLGVAFKDAGRLVEAEASYRRALTIGPDAADAHNNLGDILNEQGMTVEAETSVRRALEIRPEFIEAHCNLARIFMAQGRIVEAETSCRHALRIKPDSYEAHDSLGRVLLELGRKNEAKASYRQALQIKPDSVETRYYLVQASRAKADDGNLAALVAAEEAARSGTAPLSDKKATFLHFALGKSYDDLGDYDRAFPHFIEGCRLKRATLDYDADKTAGYFASIMRNFDEATLDSLRGGGDPSHLPIFVLGMPRSGTTLTEQIIASHPDVHGAGELSDLMDIARRNIAGTTFPDNLCLLDPARLSAWGAEYVAGLQRRAPDARRITDKMPANFLAIGLIHLMLPDAKIIHVNRNPLDTCLSCFTTLFGCGQEHTYDLAELGRYYVDYARLMDHWRKVLPSAAFLEVQYEDIVADQEAQARRLIEYCGLEWNDACLDFHKNKRVVRTASVTQVRQPIYNSSVERWRSYEQFLEPLFDALGDLAPER